MNDKLWLKYVVLKGNLLNCIKMVVQNTVMNEKHILNMLRKGKSYIWPCEVKFV